MLCMSVAGPAGLVGAADRREEESWALATKLLKDCLDDFRANGVFEWVNWAVPVPGNRVGHPNYVASVAAVQSFARDHASVKD